MARQIQVQKRNVPLEQIVAVQGQNPYATGIESLGNALGQVLTRKAQLQRQGQQLAQLSELSGEPLPTDNSLTPELYEKGLSYKKDREAKIADAARKKVELEFKLEQLRKGYSEVDPATGKITKYPGVQDVNIVYDEAGNPSIQRGSSYTPAITPKSVGGGSSLRGSNQQSNFADSFDSTPLIFHRDSATYMRPDGTPVKGKVMPLKGNQEAVQSTSKASVLFPKIDTFFDELNNMGEMGARAALAPISRNVFFPKLNQVRNELRQVGFTFGGKNYTGTEASIIEGAMIPNALDSKDARENKRAALKGYVSGQMDLLGVANLLGPAGEQIKSVLAGSKLPTLEMPKPKGLPTKVDQLINKHK